MGEAIVKMLDDLDNEKQVEDEAPSVTPSRKKSAKAS